MLIGRKVRFDLPKLKIDKDEMARRVAVKRGEALPEYEGTIVMTGHDERAGFQFLVMQSDGKLKNVPAVNCIAIIPTGYE